MASMKKTFRMTEDEVNALIIRAAETGANVYKSELLSAEKKKVNRMLFRTKVLLEKYRYLSEYCENAVYTLESAQQEDESVSDIEMLMKCGLMERDKTLQSVEKGVLTVKMYMAHVNKMLRVYRHDCESSASPVKQRQWRVIEQMYLADERKTTKAIAEIEGEEIRTIQNDAKAAREDLTALIFGIDGLLLRIIKE